MTSGEARQDPLVDAVAQVEATIEDLPDCSDHCCIGDAFHHIATCTGGQSALGIEYVVVHRDHQHRQIRGFPLQMLHHLDTAHSFESDIGNNDVRLDLTDHRQCL